MNPITSGIAASTSFSRLYPPPRSPTPAKRSPYSSPHLSPKYGGRLQLPRHSWDANAGSYHSVAQPRQYRSHSIAGAQLKPKTNSTESVKIKIQKEDGSEAKKVTLLHLAESAPKNVEMKPVKNAGKKEKRKRNKCTLM